MVTKECQDTRRADAWYVKYNTDAYAMGPLRFVHPVPATEAVELAIQLFGGYPHEVWPAGSTKECEIYTYSVACE